MNATVTPAQPDPADARAARRHLEHALLLLARVHGGDPEHAAAARDALDTWRATDTAHDAAYLHALRGWAATEAASLRDTLPKPADAAARQTRRRRALAGIGALGLAALLGAGGWWQLQQPLFAHDYVTVVGQMQRVDLADGSRLDLDARTRAHIALYRDRREVTLTEGEIRFEVAPDADRPFDVSTPWGRVRVVGTVFSVAAREGVMRVAVASGRVAVWSARAAPGAAPERTLGAGEKVAASAAGIGPVGRVRVADVAAWHDGWLAFDDTPLPEVIATWNRYLATPLVLAADPALAALRLTGSFPLHAPDAFLASLPQSHPVRVVQRARALVIEAR